MAVFCQLPGGVQHELDRQFQLDLEGLFSAAHCPGERRDCFAGRAALGGDRSSSKERRFPLAAGRTPQPAPKYESGEGHSLKRQVDALNAKIDRLIEIVESLVSKESR